MNSQEIQQTTNEYIAPTYGRFDLCLTKGDGCIGYDAEGNEYLDFTSGIGVNSLGWCDEEWKRAVAAQASTLQHTSNLYYTVPGAKLAQALCEATGLHKVFFANSGAEANEGAIKAARKYSHDKYGEGRATILTLENSFHGRTMATLSATGQPVFHQHFFPFPGGFKHVCAQGEAELAEAFTPDVCAVFIELVQGEGGVVPLEKAFVNKVAELCAQHDVLLVVDEVQTGVGRTGTFLACEQFGLAPDIVTLAKGLGGGLPIAAVLLGEKCAETLNKGDHATTYGANPVCCAGALVVLNRLDKQFLQGVAQKGELLKQGLLALPGVKAVDGLGLMLGVTFEEGIQSMDVLNAAMHKGLLCLTAKHKLRLLPPLVVTETQIAKALDTLQQVLEEIA